MTTSEEQGWEEEGGGVGSSPIHPCTALAVFKILESFRSLGRSSSSKTNIDDDHNERRNRPYKNETVTIINRSEVLGLPLAIMLSKCGATVYSIDVDSILRFSSNNGNDDVKRISSGSMTVEDCVRTSSVVVSGVPSNSFVVPTEWIMDDAIVINVAAESNFDEQTLADDAVSRRGVTYVPHVGRVTVAALEYNLMSLHRKCNSR